MLRRDEYTESCYYRLPNVSMMEKLSLMVSAGEGAVLKYDDVVFVTDITSGGFIAGIYEFVDNPDEIGYAYNECRLNLIDMSEKLFLDGGHAIEWAMRACR